MRTTLLVGGFPNPTSGGGALTAYTLLMHLLERGHEVTACVLHEPEHVDPLGKGAAERAADLERLGVRVDLLESRPAANDRSLRGRARRTLMPRPEQLFPTLADAERVRDAVRRTSPGAVFVYHWEALAASRLVTAPRIAGVGDPPHLSFFYRWRASWPSVYTARSSIQLLSLALHQPRAMVRLLRECRVAGAFAAHHAAWLRRHGVPGCLYLRTPVPDEGPVTLAASPSAEETPRILLLGHLRGIVTVSGLRVFARMLPLLEQRFGRNGFRVRIVGGFDPPPEVRAELRHPAVEFAGHTEDPRSDLAWANVFLVPNTIPLGIRVRIITAFAAGAPIVSHASNALGIPELQTGVNALLATSPGRLTDAVARLARDEPLRRQLASAARATYEKAFAPSVAAARIATVLEDAAR